MSGSSYDAYVGGGYMKPRSNIRPDSANSHRSSYSDGSRPSTSAQQHKMGGRPASAQSDRFARSRDTPTEAKPAKHVNGRPSPSAFNSNPSHISSSNVHIEDVGVFVSSVSLAMEQLSVQQITEEMNNFAENIGINHLNEPELMYIAEDFYSCPLPEGWSEFWTDDDLVYYAFQGHTQWVHPMEHFYKALVFLQRTGFRKIVEEQLQNPPTQTELQEMADYLDVDLQEEPELLDLVRMAVGAPLPPDWREDSSGRFVHSSGAVSTNHPLDVYFLEIIRTRRDEKARVEREGREAIARSQKAAVRRIIQAKGDNFKILDLPRSVSKTEIRAKYRALALDVHPDKNPQKDAQEAFQLLSCAFREVMKNMPTMRR